MLLKVYLYEKSLTVGCVIMASGLSCRFGANKLADFCGQPMPAGLCHRCTRYLCPHRGDPLGRCTGTVQDAGRPGAAAQPARPQRYRRLGLSALLEQLPELSGCMFLPGDQPLLCRDGRSYDRAFCREQPSPAEWQKKQNGRSSVWVLWPKTTRRLLLKSCSVWKQFLSELLTLPKNKGGNVLLKKYPAQVRTVYIADSTELLDADTPQVLQQLEALARLKN